MREDGVEERLRQSCPDHLLLALGSDRRQGGGSPITVRDRWCHSQLVAETSRAVLNRAGCSRKDEQGLGCVTLVSSHDRYSDPPRMT